MVVEFKRLDIVGLVIGEALHAAVAADNTHQIEHLTGLQRKYYELLLWGMEPTPLTSIARPLRGKIMGYEGNPNTQGDVTYEDLLRRMTFYRGGERVRLTPTEKRIFTVLYLHPGEMVTKHDIHKAAFVEDLDPFSRTLDVHVARLRRKLDGNEEGTVIRNVRGIGLMYFDPGRIIEAKPLVRDETSR